MLTINSDLIYAIAAIVALAVATWGFGVHRRRNHSVEQDRVNRSVQAWTELQQRCMALVEADERAGADAEELYRAVARYDTVMFDARSGRQRGPGARDPKPVSLLS